MDIFAVVLSGLALVVSGTALLVARYKRDSDPGKRVKRLELELAELADLVDQTMLSIKKLHGRANARAAREREAAQAPNPLDPMERLPGETGEQWKARMGRTLTGIRRN